MEEKLGTNKSIFNNFRICILPAGLGMKRLSLMKTSIQKCGGTVVELKKDSIINSLVTHVIVEDSYILDRRKCLDLLDLYGFENEDFKIAGTQWISKCIKEKKLCSLDGYSADIRQSFEDSSVAGTSTLPDNYSSSGVLRKAMDSLTPDSPPKRFKSHVEDFALLQTVTEKDSGNYNEVIITELQKLADAFRCSGDQWRAHGYTKAISCIRSYGKDITSFDEAQSLPGIGKKMASKIQEILESGSLRKVEEICNNEKTKVLELFSKVWGVGPSTAQSWYIQGYRSLEDLISKANLTKQQKIGLKHFDELQESIPRDEVEAIKDVVQEAALEINSKLEIVLCGSYRRGKAACGDVDVLIIKDDVSLEILPPLLQKLKNSGFVVDDLVNVEENGNQKKYLGVCKLPDCKHRRLDIFVVPVTERATALMHYTGSALFNRSIRLLAIQKGMSLSEHSLMAGIVREGKHIKSEGYIVPTPTEESIFQHLGIEYQPPEKRNR